MQVAVLIQIFKCWNSVFVISGFDIKRKKIDLNLMWKKNWFVSVFTSNFDVENFNHIKFRRNANLSWNHEKGNFEAQGKSWKEGSAVYDCFRAYGILIVAKTFSTMLECQGRMFNFVKYSYCVQFRVLCACWRFHWLIFHLKLMVLVVNLPQCRLNWYKCFFSPATVMFKKDFESTVLMIWMY
jgi:hypothetical protein